MKQANLGLNIQQLVERQRWLQDEARIVLHDFHLVETLRSAGKPMLVGSVATELMVWPDIDLEVLTEGVPNLDSAIGIMRELLGSGIREVNIADHRNTTDDLANGIYIGPDLEHRGLRWQIDIWLIEEQESTQRRRSVAELMRALDDRHRRTILQLKQILAANDKYHRGISSVDLYAAVLQHGVSNVDEFETYLNRSGRTLS